MNKAKAVAKHFSTTLKYTDCAVVKSVIADTCFSGVLIVLKNLKKGM